MAEHECSDRIVIRSRTQIAEDNIAILKAIIANGGAKKSEILKLMTEHGYRKAMKAIKGSK